MRLSLFSLLALAILATSPALAKPRLSPEAELADAIKGREAGKPVSCISTANVSSTRIIDKTAILYDAGRVIYVNRPRSGARQLDRWDTLVTRTFNQELCQPDVVHLYDGASRSQTGTVFLGEFVPYRRVRKPAE